MLTKKDAKFIRSLQNKKDRKANRLFLVEGKKSIEELLTSSLTIKFLIVNEQEAQKVEGRIDPSLIKSAKPREISQVSFYKTNTFGLAVVEIPTTPRIESTGPMLILDGIQDPGNLGTIVRIADWYNWRQIVCSEDTVDFFNPKVIQATMGSFARIIPSYTDLPAFLSKINKPVFLADMEGEGIYSVTFPTDFALVIGSEPHGASEDILHLGPRKISIPRRGGAESLNAAVATAIILDNWARP